MKVMSAGEMVDRATFQAPVLTPDGGGGGALEWTTQFTVWGRMIVGSARERLEAGRLEASDAAMLRVRQSSQSRQIKPDWRVIVNGDEYQIRQHPQDPDRSRRWLDISIERGVAV